MIDDQAGASTMHDIEFIVVMTKMVFLGVNIGKDGQGNNLQDSETV